MPHHDPDAAAAYQRAYREAHREEVKARARAYREAHREEKGASPGVRRPVCAGCHARLRHEVPDNLCGFCREELKAA